MSRLLTLLMIVILVIAHGTSVAAAVCRHESSVEHVAALHSRDAAISAVAFSEEAAGKVASKKGTATDGGSVASPSDMLPMPGLAIPFRASEPVERDWAAAPFLAGASVRPLLEPPSA
ncbi:MAG: hypothetical protein QOG72_2015 [Sphingomonadales bacterium]|jgi:hypothetical protein|nr:hypothetical protein [Sphingomonadales bacterium]